MKRKTLLVIAGVLGCGGSGSTNHAPVANPAAAVPSLVMGQSTGLDAHATDQDGDSLTYSWTQAAPVSPQGSFSSQTSAAPSWTAPTVPQTTQFILEVTVSDGKGGTTTEPVIVFSRAPTDPSFSANLQPILMSCIGSGCHNPPLAEYQTLLTSTESVECPGQRLVKPGDPDHSGLVETLEGDCTNRMPLGGPYLSADQVNLFRTWILQGAWNN
jgi:hypothetical protein